MRIIDPITQCEKPNESKFVRMSASLMLFAAAAGFMPKKPKISKGMEPWKCVNLSKSERLLSPENRDELRRYKWTLKEIRDREIWPGMIL